MHRLSWAALSAALFFFFTVTVANSEPFGVALRKDVPQWRIILQKRFEDRDRPLILHIVAQVRKRPVHQWLTWVNQLVNLQVPGTCDIKAAAAVEVLRELGYEHTRILVGQDIRNSVPVVKREQHAMASVRVGGQWYLLDNRAFVRDYRATLPSELRTSQFKPLYVID